MQDGPSAGLAMLERAEILYHEYQRDPHDVRPLDTAIGDLRRCLSMVSPDAPVLLALVRLRLGTALCKRWEFCGGRQYAEGAELLAQAAEGLRDTPEEMVAQANLAGVAPAMYQLTSQDRWRRAGVDAARRAEELGGAEDAALRKENLALNLLGRFERSRDSTALHEAMEAAQIAVRETTEGGVDRARRLCLLAQTFWVRHRLDEGQEDFDLAEQLVLIALRTVPRGHVDEPGMLNQLAMMLRDYGGERRDVGCMEEAVALSAAAVAGAPPGGDRLLFQLNHVGALLNLHLVTRRAELLPIANSASAEMLDAMPVSHTMRATALRARANVELRLGDPDSAAARLDEAVRTPDTPYWQIKTARQAATLAAESGRWDTAAAMLAHAVSLMPRLASRQLSRRDQERSLAEFDALVRDACAYAIQAGDANGALVVLEHGTGLLFRQLLDDREDLHALRQARPDLTDRIEACRTTFALPPSPDPAFRDEIHAAAEEWERTVAEARAVPGFASLFAAPRLDELRTAAVDGPIIVVNISYLRADALVLTPHGVEVVELPDAGAEVAQARFRAFMPDVDSDGSGLPDTLTWLWDAIARPVLDHLDIGPHDGHHQWRRVWWSPTGPFVFLPLEHAGRHDKPGDSVADRVVSSRAPSIQALLRARKRPACPVDGRRLVVVSVPDAPAYPRLPGVRSEAEAIRDHVTLPVTVLENATRADVLDAIRGHTHAHLACHVEQSVRMPTAARVVLLDHETAPLTLRDIARLDLSRAELLFLSACTTGRGGIALTEELVDLASAFQVAGYRHVVATLWKIRDDAARTVTAEVYQALAQQGLGDTAPAVHKATRAMKALGLPPILWASHFHTGP